MPDNHANYLLKLGNSQYYMYQSNRFHSPQHKVFAKWISSYAKFVSPLTKTFHFYHVRVAIIKHKKAQKKIIKSIAIKMKFTVV